MAQVEPGFRGLVGRTPAESTPWWPSPARPPEGAPHVVVVVLDDVGFSDFACFGSEIATPTIDRLAAGGLRYVNFHTTALCSPTRACLLTGRDHHAVGMGLVSDWDLGYPAYRGRVTRAAGMLPEVLRPHGYSTYAVGKWHLTPLGETGPAGPFDNWPLARGFDRFYGFFEGETNQWQPTLVPRPAPGRAARATRPSTSAPRSSTRPSPWCATSARPRPTGTSCCTWRSGRATARTTRRPR